MDALWFYAILFIGIWVISIIFHKKLKIEIQGPILRRKTTRMRSFIDKAAKRHERFWRVFMTIGIPIAVFFMGVMLYSFILILGTLLEPAQAASQVGVLLPGVDVPGSAFYVPLGYGIIALMTVIVVHEFGHGILARVEGVSIKSIGLLLLAVLPAAFVEPDEEEIKKSKRISKLRIYAAGSIFNLSLAAIALVIFILSGAAIGASFQTDGVQISSVVPASPASNILKEGMVIQEINGITIKNSTDYQEILNKTKPGDVLTFKTDQGTYVVKTGTNPNNQTKFYIGIRTQNHLVPNVEVSSIFGNILPVVLFYFNQVFYWIFTLNFLVGTFNLLPMKPLDGGLMFEELLQYKISKKKVKPIVSTMSWVIIVTLAFLMVLVYGRGLLLLL
ncbi:MAG: site-2 protease family protein [Methanobacteriaceae archaeon]